MEKSWYSGIKCSVNSINDFSFNVYHITAITATPSRQTINKLNQIPFWELFCIFIGNSIVRVLSKKIIRQFWESHPDAEEQLKSWFQETSKGKWPNPNFVKDEFPNARLIPNNRVIFNIKGNQYRLIVRVNYKYQMVYVRFIGTHLAYDKIDPKTI